MDNKKPSYKELNGTTRVGDALRWLVKQGKVVAPELLALAGNITGIDALEKLSGKVTEDKGLSETDKQLLLEEIAFAKVEMEETTKRWVSDNATDSYLTRNIRPITLAFLTASMFIYIILDSTIEGFKMDDAWISLLGNLLMLVYGAYFGMRSMEKVFKK